jgi:hypothetical protein
METGMIKARYEPLKPGRPATDERPELNTNRKNTLMAMLGIRAAGVRRLLRSERAMRSRTSVMRGPPPCRSGVDR